MTAETNKPTAGDVALHALAFTFGFILVAMFAFRTYLYYLSATGGAPGKLTDWDSFHITALLVWKGEAAKAYYAEFLRPFQAQFGTQFLSWAYPPQFDLILAPFGLMRLDVGYALFIGPTLVFYLLVLRRVAREHFLFAFVVSFPALMFNITGGQNGFLTGGLIGLACLALLDNKAGAGVPLGLMIIKPHVAVPFAIEALLNRRWRVIGVGLVVVALSFAAATLAFGPGIWPAFLNGMAEAQARLLSGAFVLEIMTSVYAFLRSTGSSAGFAMAAQGVFSLLMVGMVAVAVYYKWPERRVLGVTVLVAPFLSPYAFLYDMPIFGIALGLLAPDLKRLMSRGELVVFGVVGFLTSFIGYFERWNQIGYSLGNPDLPRPTAIGFGGALAPLMILMIWHALRRDAKLRKAAQEDRAMPSQPPVPRARRSRSEAAGRPDPARMPEAPPARAPARSAP